MKTQREKKLEIALLKEKIERISNKKVLFKEDRDSKSNELIIELRNVCKRFETYLDSEEISEVLETLSEFYSYN